MLESIVRPFQTIAEIISNATPVTSVITAPKQKAQLVWGAVGQPPSMYSLYFKTLPGVNNHKEATRSTSNVQITNPDDPNQYIITQRIDSISFTLKTDITNAAGVTTFAPVVNPDTVNSPTSSSVVGTINPATSTDVYSLNQPTAP